MVHLQADGVAVRSNPAPEKKPDWANPADMADWDCSESLRAIGRVAPAPSGVAHAGAARPRQFLGLFVIAQKSQQKKPAGLTRGL
jgi:hypothetical protein